MQITTIEHGDQEGSSSSTNVTCETSENCKQRIYNEQPAAGLFCLQSIRANEKNYSGNDTKRLSENSIKISVVISIFNSSQSSLPHVWHRPSFAQLYPVFSGRARASQEANEDQYGQGQQRLDEIKLLGYGRPWRKRKLV